MPVLVPNTFKFEFSQIAKDANGATVQTIPHADVIEKWVLHLALVAWNGGPFDTDVPVEIFFSDNRAKVATTVAWDTGADVEVTAATNGFLTLTIVDKTSSSQYAVTKILQFS